MFVISWVNPDERHADKGFEAYMREGIFAALEAIEAATGETRRRGDRLLRRRHAARGDARLHGGDRRQAHLQRDLLHHAGRFHRRRRSQDLRRRRAAASRSSSKMAEAGYLDGAQMANAFNMLRPNDLIWSYWVNNYLKGKEPMAFDLLVWNSDCDAHARRQPPLLSAPLLSAERPHQRPHGDRGPADHSAEGDDPDLRSRRARRTTSRRRNPCSPARNSSAARCAM